MLSLKQNIFNLLKRLCSASLFCCLSLFFMDNFNCYFLFCAQKQTFSILIMFADLLTAAQVFFRRYTALDCRADRMAHKEEKFFSSLHSFRENIKNSFCYAACFDKCGIHLWQLFWTFFNPDLCNSDPPLDDAFSVGAARAWGTRWVWGSGGIQEGRGGVGWWVRRGSERAGGGRAKEWSDDTIGDSIELGDGGTDCGRQVLVPLLVTLRPDAAQAVERYHFDKQFLSKTDGGSKDKQQKTIQRKALETESGTEIKYQIMKPTASNLVNCSATSLAGKSMTLCLSSSLEDISPPSSSSLQSCCNDSLLCSDADWLQSVKRSES